MKVSSGQLLVVSSQLALDLDLNENQVDFLTTNN